MGHRNYTTFGYGLLLLDENNENLFDIREEFYGKYPKGIEEEAVGDLCLGEDEGVFYYIKSVKISYHTDSGEYTTDYVVEYSDFEVTEVDPALEAWLANFQEENNLIGKIGVFQTEYFG